VYVDDIFLFRYDRVHHYIRNEKMGALEALKAARTVVELGS
jgi:hypothetical protein